jgi:HEAT repeat protein
VLAKLGRLVRQLPCEPCNLKLSSKRAIGKHPRSIPVKYMGTRLTGPKFVNRGPIVRPLRAKMLDPAVRWQDRADACRRLTQGGGQRAIAALLRQFSSQTEKDEIYSTALTIESVNDRRAVAPLITALLQDTNPHRRQGAARALGWIRPSDRATARALAQCLADPAQPHAAREEAAESLSYVGTNESVDALISVLKDSDVRLRFWAVFGLGGICREGEDPRAARALESMLEDTEIAPGNWWSVGKEALAILASSEVGRERHEPLFRAEVQRILADPKATSEDLRWAKFYRFKARS